MTTFHRDARRLKRGQYPWWALAPIMRTALRTAKAHVYRQQYAGRHAQDRQDAWVWWALYAKM